MKFTGIVSALFLTGCTGSTYSSQFDCPIGQGAGCASISRVNKMLDAGQINIEDELGHTQGKNQTKEASHQVTLYYGPAQPGRVIDKPVLLKGQS